jgi:hypothetical protein
MMKCMSAETRAELIAASRAYEREQARTDRRMEAVRTRLHAAIIAEKREDADVKRACDPHP